MMRFRPLFVVAVGVLVIGLASVALGMNQEARPLQPPASVVGGVPTAMPFVIVQTGNTTWVQPLANSTHCPGDPLGGHGGEATGGPDGSQTWCVEGGVGDTCGTVSPWNTHCFNYVDVRALPSQTGINYWHIDSYRTNQVTYTGSRALWCGSAATWNGKPVECGTWKNPPGYGNQWNCQVQLTLPSSFNVAGGCTLYFDPRYDTECKYDYYYIDYWNGSTWNTLATFNATSNNPGGTCGAPGKVNPDYWSNTDANRLVNCNWQQRTVTGQPAFKGIITHAMLGTVTTAPRLRWRFTSDGAFSDADGRGDTDGAAFLDNIKVYGNAGNFYAQDFETCTVFGSLPQYWSFGTPTGVAQAWHVYHDADPPYEGGDGGTRSTCQLDSSWAWRARPNKGYPVGSKQRFGFYYRLLSPRLRIQNTGCAWQYDQFMCATDPPACDYTDTQVRFHDSVNATWCPWVDIDGYILYGGCFFWNFDRNEDVTKFYGASNDSMQFGWELLDNSTSGALCQGKHAGTENIIDNVSVGFYDGSATQYSARGIDILHDSFLPMVDAAYNSFFDAYSADSINWYKNSAHTLRKTTQMYLNVGDKDGIATVQIKASINNGATWITKTMTMDQPADPAHPALGGSYYGTVKAGDFHAGDLAWPVGTECWYYVLTTDALANQAYFPARANPTYPTHNGTRDDYFGFTILPQFPASYHGVKILLVDGHGRNLYDWSPCLTVLDKLLPLRQIYENTLVDAGYCYDRFDISGAGSNQYIQPIWFTDYDAVIWFTGPYFDTYLFGKEAQEALRAYMADSGKVVLCGDRIAYDMGPTAAGGHGEDSLGGEFLSGVMGTSYISEMESGFDKPFLYAKAAPTVNVFGTPKSIPIDSVCIYRECPYLKDMSYVQTNPTPPAGYTAQPLLHLLNPTGTVTHADEAMYVEYLGAGQCVFFDFDLCATVNHKRTFCTGVTPAPAPDFVPGSYYGRVELLKTVLNTLFGLPPLTGGGGMTGVEHPATFKWALSQNSPNPINGATEIRFEVASASNVSIKVYNAMGQLVSVLKDARTEPGRYSVTWDGRNQSGEHVSSGVYFYKMEAGQYSAVKKMLVLK